MLCVSRGEFQAPVYMLGVSMLFARVDVDISYATFDGLALAAARTDGLSFNVIHKVSAG